MIKTRGGQKEKLGRPSIMQVKVKIKNNQRKINLIKRRIKNRKFQKEAIYSCSPGEVAPEKRIRHVNDKAWDVIWFIAQHVFAGEPVTSSDVYLGTGQLLAKLDGFRIHLDEAF